MPRVLRSFSRTPIAVAIGLLCGTPTVFAEEALNTKATADVDEVYIVGIRENRTSKGALGLALDVEDTPQSISLVSSELIEGFGANSLNDALRLATGIQVEEWETNRTNYLARGFEIKNTQIDGVGLPNDWGIVTGAMDSYGYEKLEVIRGANGLLTGVGNSAGTINYVRKRPTNEQQGNLSISGGSFNSKRIEGDYSTPFTSDGEWAGRIVVASEDKDSYLRGLSNDRTFVYGVVDGQIGDKSTITFGYSYQEAHTTGNMWGSLVLVNTDGTQAEYKRSASTTQDWTMWDTVNETAFVEYTYALSDNLSLKATYNHREYESNSKLFYAYSYTGINKTTGLGLSGWPGQWDAENHADLFDITLNGNFTLFDREQSAILGVSSSRSELDNFNHPFSYTNEPAYGPLLIAFPYAGDALPEPKWGAKTLNSETNQTLKRIYGATTISLTDKLTAVAGFNGAEYHRDGLTDNNGSYKPFSQTERKFSPYAGFTYKLSDNTQAYASYSDIYQPQDYYDEHKDYLAASKGINFEVGVKSDWLDKRMLTTFAIFTAEQKGLGIYAGMTSDSSYYYKGMTVNSKGVEAEVTGKLSQATELVFGITSLQLEDDDGKHTYFWIPRDTVNLALTSRLNDKVQIGVSGKWQNDIHNGPVSQDAYATLNTFVRWDFATNAHTQLNINNITNEKYLTSLYVDGGYYAAPINATLSVSYSF